MLPMTLLAWIAAVALAYAQTPAPAAPQAAARPPHTRDQYAGVDACRPCHAGHVRTFPTTAHGISSRLATRESVAGPFSATATEIATSNPDLVYRLGATDEGF